MLDDARLDDQETGDDWKDWREYWQDYATVFAQPLQANGMLHRFVKNTDVTGAYAEAWLRSMVSAMLPELRVSTGAILRSGDRERDLSKVPQCDIIVWDPSDLPAIFEQGEFALVPNFSVRAVIEVKRTCSSVPSLQTALKKRQQYMMAKHKRHVLGVILSHTTNPFRPKVRPAWLEDTRLGDGPEVTRLLSGSSNDPDPDGVMTFVYFLSQVAAHSNRAAAHRKLQQF